MFEKTSFPALDYTFNANIKVGETSDNGLNSKNIDNWDLGKSYLVIKATNKENSLLYSKHFPLTVKVN